MRLTRSELEIMNTLWRENRPLSRSDIVALAEKTSWTDSSFYVLLKGLLKKEAIKEAGVVKIGKSYGRLFAANITCEEYYASAVSEIGGKENLPKLFAALLQRDYITPEIIKEMEVILAQKREELENREK